MDLPPAIRDWLLSGDVAVQFQVQRDLLCAPDAVVHALQQRIATEGWGARFLACRGTNGHWGSGFYMPKWASTHYTLFDLYHLGLASDNEQARDSTAMVLGVPTGRDGGVNYWGENKRSDVCVNGMMLSFASWFQPRHERLCVIVDYLLDSRMDDGGWNCRHRRGAVHSSVHSTISVLEGLLEFRQTGRAYRRDEILEAEQSGVEFLLGHRLFRSHRTGEIIHPAMLRLSYPFRWKYDILRALDFLRKAGRPYDERMSDALGILRDKRRSDGTWPLQARHPGEVHFDMEKPGRPSRWNTLRALRVLARYS